jgi:hypothetical protein
MRHRVAIAFAVAILAAAYVLASPRLFPGYVSDFDQLWQAARAWRTGGDPYAAVLATHNARGLSFGLLYPFPAVVAALPLSWLSLPFARAVVAATAAGCLTFLVLGRAWWLFPLLLSGAFRASISLVQLTPFAACAVIDPLFGWVFALKPNSGAAVLATADRRRWVLWFLSGAAVLGALAFALWPGWVRPWFDALRTGGHLTPIVARPFGWLLLLAAFRWRRPEARWLLAAAVLPGTPASYESQPLLVMLPQTFRQALTFALLSHLGDIGGYFVPHGNGMAGLASARASVLLATLYLPALGLILWRENRQPELSSSLSRGSAPRDAAVPDG